MSNIGVFYGPAGGSTERVARLIAKEYGDNIDLIAVDDVTVEQFNNYDNIICGVATIGQDSWNQDVKANSWNSTLSKLSTFNLEGKKIACFGLGNQITYGSKFVDALGVLVERLGETGATIVGEVTTDGYNFEESLAEKDGKFVGLPIDEDTEDEKTLGRVQCWIEQLKGEF